MATVSVIMGIYNCAKTLPEAIDSILNQTFTDWELIMCDDGSEDNTYEVAMEYKNKYPDKFVILKNETNMGLNATLNRCLKESTGKYIARMDGDDICEKERFAMEMEVLESEPEIAIVSTDMSFFDESGTWGSISRKPYPEKKDFLNGTPFCHAPCMVRKEAYDKVGGYSVGDKFLRVEDFHLWFKMYREGFKGKNINKILYCMRDDRNAYSRRKFKYRLNEAYVTFLVVKEFKLPLKGYLVAIKPILVGLLPGFLYDKLHKWKLGKDRG